MNVRIPEALKCPVCVLTSGTWIILLVLHFSGYRIDLVIPAALMGGSVVGIAYRYEFSMWKKLMFIPLGFLLVWSVVREAWSVALPVFMALVATGICKSSSQNVTPTTRDLENKMKNCC